MSLQLTFDTGRRLVYRTIDIRLFPLYQEHVRPLSELLAQSEPTDPESSLGAINLIYERQGWRAPRHRPLGTALVPSLVAPHLPYSTHYEVMGVTVTELETVVQEFVPHYSLQSAQLTLCREMEDDTSTALAFPFVVEPSLEVTASLYQQNRIHVVPVFTLPLVMSLLPHCYQRASNTLQECERLRGTLIQQANHIQLRRQLELMDVNRHYLAFRQQQAMHYHQVPLARRDTERLLFEAEFAALVSHQLAQTEAASARQRKIRRKLRQLKK